jgi:hypothetical protein
MIVKKVTYIAFFFMLSGFCFGQVNNIIFLGGNGNGSVSTCFESISNHPIYAGGIGHGDQSACFAKVANNFIFAGGNADGIESSCFVLISNNSIFAGNVGDGYTGTCYVILSNNQIFAGGDKDGNESACFTLISNNSIYAGNNGDGYIGACFLKISNNPIYAGNDGDGSDLGELLVQSPTIVWHGLKNSDWHNRFNWDQNRIPTINDFVIIRTEKFDPFLRRGWLGVGDQSSGIREFSRNLYVLSGSSLTLDKTSKANIRKDLNIYGIFNSFNNIDRPVVQLYDGATATIFDQGMMNLLNQ